MRVITLASRKGGAGKTTLSCHLAVEAERCGAGPVALIDGDEMAGLQKWWKERVGETPVLCEIDNQLPNMLAVLKERGFRVVIIDTSPSMTPFVAEAVSTADLVLIPVQPTPDDLRAIGATVSVVEQTRRKSAFILNRVKKRVRLTAEAAVALSEHGAIAPVMVHDRTDYAAAKTAGLTAPEIDPTGPAAVEIAGLWAYVSGRLGGTP